MIKTTIICKDSDALECHLLDGEKLYHLDNGHLSRGYKTLRGAKVAIRNAFRNEGDWESAVFYVIPKETLSGPRFQVSYQYTTPESIRQGMVRELIDRHKQAQSN